MDDRERQAFMADLQKMLEDRDAAKKVDALEDAVRQLGKADAKHGFALLELREQLIRLRADLDRRPPVPKRRTPWGKIGTALAAIGAMLAAAAQYLSDLIHR